MLADGQQRPGRRAWEVLADVVRSIPWHMRAHAYYNMSTMGLKFPPGELVAFWQLGNACAQIAAETARGIR